MKLNKRITYKCEYCGRTFRLKYNFSIHKCIKKELKINNQGGGVIDK